MALAEERKPAIDSYIKDLVWLPAKISQSSIVVSFFQRRQTDPEWFQQFPQKINRFGEHGNSFDQSKAVYIKEDTQEPHITGSFKDDIDCLDSGHESYMNPSFEASGSVG